MLGMKTYIIFPKFQTQILRRSDESFCFSNGRYFISIWVRCNCSNFLCNISNAFSFVKFWWLSSWVVMVEKGNKCKWNAVFSRIWKSYLNEPCNVRGFLLPVTSGLYLFIKTFCFMWWFSILLYQRSFEVLIPRSGNWNAYL